ncbi:LysR family transcriptional regulator [Streptomyces chrestomyceticus JCM 4735]|uniref:LysR family transcriptional regulator n=1 Tax=Streptomyces chrestomyceticus JCM 4735 TaxID=1306181 RepID=A0A7U9KWV0_9ACTN|nr:LysR family transcriptional regulator [Streptomyces chrestomyceticus JCM 4735]
MPQRYLGLVTLDDLRAFVAVCEAHSLSAVARDLGCTQSAVSQRVKRLEREAGIALLERRPRGVAPTQAGRILCRAATGSLAELDLALRRLADLRRGDGGTLRITTGATTVRHFMSAAVVAFRARHPHVDLEFQTENSGRRCFEAVADGTAELAWITIGPPVRGIEQHPVLELPWVLAVRSDDPLAGRDHIEPAELAGGLSGIRHIRLPENSVSRMRLDGHLGRGRPETGEGPAAAPASSTSVADWDTAILLAELGVGHAVVPDLPGWRGAGHPSLRLIPIPGLPPLAAGWAVRQWAALSPVAVEFAETVNGSLGVGGAGGGGTAAGPGAASGTAAGADARARARRLSGVEADVPACAPTCAGASEERDRGPVRARV